MRNISLYILSLSTLFLVFSCANSSEETPVVSVEKNVLVESSNRGENSAEDSYILFARKWEAPNNIYVDLQLDGSFEANLDGENEIFGRWAISDDQKELQLSENQSHEGKGNSFNAVYTIVDISDSKLTVMDDQNKEWNFTSK